ncbi:hypothetical protein D8674_010650 [Pyrus ussuriensis x Pyrus communis]|uniref:Uncharacterized protein n=1 Tax=Pyrus ussuriensis x Pyrus communis TaxID=2448454 RepID=A0A5N5FBB0_9ROSA|nr:hypothetical protein D8674_010650 [Pyrus ussuriensis x Pyrus communis]
MKCCVLDYEGSHLIVGHTSIARVHLANCKKLLTKRMHSSLFEEEFSVKAYSRTRKGVKRAVHGRNPLTNLSGRLNPSHYGYH